MTQEAPKPMARALVIDDSPVCRAQTARLLKKSGNLSTVEASDYKTALKLLQDEEFDIVLLDYYLDGGYSGLDFLSAMGERTATIPVIMLTGEDETTGLDSQLLQAGAVDYILKSELQERNLARSVRYALERARATRDRQRASELEQEKGRLSESVAGLEQVLAVVGHELRTPLAGVRAIAELGIEQCEDSSVRSSLESIRTEVVRLSEVVNDIMDATRMHKGIQSWDWEEVTISTVVGEALRSLMPLIDSSKVSLEVSIQPKTLTIVGDPGALVRLIQNLVSNSIKYTNEGKIYIHIYPRSDEDYRWVVVETEDTGIGMPVEIIKRLGEPFALSSGAVGNHFIQGSGFGMAIVKGIIAIFGGTLTVSSEEGKGTRFVAELRRDLPQAMAQTAEAINIAIK